MPAPPIIDIHCHTAGIGAGGSGCFVSSALRSSWKYRIYLRSFGVTEKDLAGAGDGLVVRRISEALAASRRVSSAVILAMDGVIGTDGHIDPSRTEIFIPNDFVARQVRACRNLLFGASVNPYRRDALERLEQAAADGAVLLKWLPSIQQIDPADLRLAPFYRLMADLGLPLLSHTGDERSFTQARDELCDPERLRLPLEQGVTVIAAHAGSNGTNDGERNHVRFARLCARYSNLYADISALTQLNRLGHLPRLLRHTELHDRLLYGTDMPLPMTGITSPWFHAWALPPQTLRRILAEKNPWDRDVALKSALGVTEELLSNTAALLGRRHLLIHA